MSHYRWESSLSTTISLYRDGRRLPYSCHIWEAFLGATGAMTNVKNGRLPREVGDEKIEFHLP